jgi:glutathione S-transferase
MPTSTTSPNPLAGSTLFVSARSPFARRVRIAFLEDDLPFTEKVVDVMAPPPELIAKNPLARVPTLVTPQGEVLVESQVILEHLGDHAAGRPTERGARRRADLFSALATGLCEKAVEYFFDSQRPAAQRDAALQDEVKQCGERVMVAAEAALGTAEYLIGKSPASCDRDLAIALTYWDLRVGREWKTRFPRIAALQARLEARESFKRTAPPPPA